MTPVGNHKHIPLLCNDRVNITVMPEASYKWHRNILRCNNKHIQSMGTNISTSTTANFVPSIY